MHLACAPGSEGILARPGRRIVFRCHRSQGVAWGIMLGASEGELEEPLMRQAAEFCRAAGADEVLIPGGIKEGRADAGRVPFGPPRRIRPGQHPPGRAG